MKIWKMYSIWREHTNQNSLIGVFIDDDSDVGTHNASFVESRELLWKNTQMEYNQSLHFWYLPWTLRRREKTEKVEIISSWSEDNKQINVYKEYSSCEDNFEYFKDLRFDLCFIYDYYWLLFISLGMINKSILFY